MPHSYATAPDPDRLSTIRMVLGLVAAAAIGLTVYCLLTIAETFVEVSVAHYVFAQPWDQSANKLLGLLPIMLLFGLPLALLFSFAVGLPVWKQADSPMLRSARHAARFGALTGLIIGGIFVLLGLLLGSDSNYNEWRWGYQTLKDGVPTLLGWVFELLNVLFFTVAGVGAGLIARWVGIPKDQR